MRLNELVDTLGLTVTSASSSLARDVGGGYSSDLLSDAIANANEGDIWITLQTHVNIVAVAVMKDIAGIILVNGRKPDSDTLERAKKEDVPIMISEMPAFELIGRLYQIGVSGQKKDANGA